MTADHSQVLDRPIPAEYREYWTAQLAGKAAERAAADLSLLVFRLGSEQLALPSLSLEEVTAARPWHRIPHRSGAVLLGLLNLNGELLFCFSAKAVLGLAEGDPKEEPRGSMIVLNRAGARHVFMTDEIIGMQRIARSELGAAPATVNRSQGSLITGMFSLGAEPAAVIDPAALAAVFNSALEGHGRR